MVSGARMRALLELGGEVAPQPSLVHVGEIFNYNHIEYPPTSTTELTLVTELVATNIKIGAYLLQIGVQAPAAQAHRRPTSVTVLVDTSQSMEGDALIRANASIEALARSLNKDDILSRLTTDSEVKPVKRRAQSDGDPELFQGADAIKVSGSGSLANGLTRAYDQAGSKESYIEGGLNRIVVITDGGGLASSIDTDLIAARWKTDRIRLVGVGVGSPGSYKNDLLAAATTAGHGASLYIGSKEEATRALHQRFDEVMDEAAGNVSISFHLPWIFRNVSAELPLPADLEAPLTLSDLGRGRSMVFRRPVIACAGVDPIANGELPIAVTASWTEPGTDEARKLERLVPLKEALIAKPSNQMLKASAVLAFANALQSLDVARFQDACAKVNTARAAFEVPIAPDTEAGDPELDSIWHQLSGHPVMKGKSCP
jgi:Ca-activated chloride channel family protein